MPISAEEKWFVEKGTSRWNLKLQSSKLEFTRCVKKEFWDIRFVEIWEVGTQYTKSNHYTAKNVIRITQNK